MLKITILIFLSLSTVSFSQQITIVDAASKEPIPFVTIQYNNNEGIYSNENGMFDLKQITTDSLTISHIGYTTFKLLKKDIDTTIKLAPNAILLNEFNLAANNNGIKEFYLKPVKSNFFNDWLTRSKKLLFTKVIASEKMLGKKINAIEFYYSGVDLKNKKIDLKDFKVICRLNIYTGSLDNKIYSSNALFIDNLYKKGDALHFNLKDEKIFLDENVFYFGIEVIGVVDKSNNLVEEEFYLRIKNTEEINPLLNNESFVTGVFNNNTFTESINKSVENGFPGNKKFNRNTAFKMIFE